MGAVGNGAGLPAISVLNGFSEKGLPTGIQLMARAYDENVTIAIVRAYRLAPTASARSVLSGVIKLWLCGNIDLRREYGHVQPYDSESRAARTTLSWLCKSVCVSDRLVTKGRSFAQSNV
jgi:Amidase